MNRANSVDEYIANAGQWQTQLKKLRKILLTTKLVEEIKWGAPCYTYDGKNVVGMASFKSYFGLWFHQGALLDDKHRVLINAQEGTTKALRQWRMNSASDIKTSVIKAYAIEAMQLVKDGRSIGPQKKKPIVVPPQLLQTLSKNNKAKTAFAALRPGLQREYADFVAGAKREETRLRRIEKIVPLIVAGKGLNDQYR